MTRPVIFGSPKPRQDAMLAQRRGFAASLALVLPMALPMTLMACGSEREEGQVEVIAEGDVTGEVLEGSVSDEMIPFDQIRSQSPFVAPKPDLPGENGAGGAGTADDSADENAGPSPAQTQQADGANASASSRGGNGNSGGNGGDNAGQAQAPSTAQPQSNEN